MCYYKRGQAMVEYLLIFSLAALIGINMIKGLAGYVDTSISTFGNVISKHLAVGVCENDCYFSGYLNK